MIQAGNKIEIIEYEKPVFIKNKLISNDKARTNELNSDKRAKSIKCRENALAFEKIRNREIVLYRARNEVRRLINANVHRYYDEQGRTTKPVFLTLTFADNIQDITAANKELRKFLKRLGNYLAKDQAYVQYVAVPEFQRRGAVHYHLIVFNLPYIKSKTLETIWGNGFIKLKAVEEVDNIGATLASI